MTQRKPPPDPPRADPTLRELRATLERLWFEKDNLGDRQLGAFMHRTYDHMAFLLDAFLFDVDPDQDDGGRS